MTSLPYIMYALWPLLASSQVIVGQRWPPPRWFLGSSAPPGEGFVIAQSNQVIAQTITVVAPV